MKTGTFDSKQDTVKFFPEVTNSFCAVCMGFLKAVNYVREKKKLDL
jgi:hypothetical protein